MNRVRGWAALIVLLTACAAAVAGEPSVDSILAKHLAARGGADRLRALQSVRLVGRVDAGGGREARVVREIARPNHSRFEFTVQGVTSVYVSDGKQGWAMAPVDGTMRRSPMSDDAVAEAAEQADVEGPLVDWRTKGHRVELLGREQVGGREAFHLRVTLASGASREQYIDVRSHQLVRTVATHKVRGREVRIVTTMRDFKKTSGLTFPRRITVRAEGRPNELLVIVERVEVELS